MGLIARIKQYDHDRRKSLQSPSPSHTKASESVSSAASDFSHMSVSSASSQDSGTRPIDSFAKNKALPKTHMKGVTSYRNSMPTIPAASSKSEGRKKDLANGAHSGLRQQQGHQMLQGHQISQGQQTPQSQHSQQSIVNPGRGSAASLPPTPGSSLGLAQDYSQGHSRNHFQTSEQSPAQDPSHVQSRAAGSSAQGAQAAWLAHNKSPSTSSVPSNMPGQNVYSQQPPGAYLGAYSGAYPEAGEDSHPSMSEESVSEDSRDEGSASTSDGDSEAAGPARDHPYYEQWKQYYRALEKQKQRQPQAQASSQSGQHSPQVQTHFQFSQQQQQQQQHNESPLPSLTPSPSPSISPTKKSSDSMSRVAQNNASERFYNIVQTAEPSNSLVMNSRRSTIRSNRSASMPPAELSKPVPRSRVVSMNAAVSEDVVGSGAESEDNSNAMKVPKQRQPSAVSAVGRFRQVSGISEKGDQISDYAAFIMSDESDPDELGTKSGEDPKPKTDKREVSASSAGLSRNPTTWRGVSASNTENDLQSVLHYYQEPGILETDENGDLNRKSSSASASSFGSLQSEKHFNVGPSLRRVATPSNSRASVAGSRRKSRGSSGQKFSPPMPGPPPPISPMVQPQNFQDFEMQRKLSSFKRQSTGNLPMSDMYMQQIQQQIQQLQQLQQMQQIQNMQHFQHSQHMGFGSSGPQFSGPRSSDNFINKKIEEFVHLRTIIAAGNKSFEYRLKWLQMLICATNNRLFAYVNIKGEGIAPEQVEENKQFFIRSCVNHLHKLLRELARSSSESMQKLYAEACYLQGCFFSHAFVERFGQDFCHEFNAAEAERFFNLCLEYNPGYFRAYYELGELYELSQDEAQFELALENFTESAKMGYNRAIYKVALIQLLVPKERSTKFFSYFKKLADVDLSSNDVQLSGADRDELEEIVGLAQFQLGKLYEGIYPGDLTPEDEFVQASLEIAPVTYSKSISYYNKSAKLSCVHAQVRLAKVYEDAELGRGYNPKKSIQWYMTASTSPLKYRRHPEAMLGLSRWYMKGSEGASKHIPYPDSDMAVEWCERACREFAFPEAFYQMALLVEEGYANGDPSQWYEQAWAGGHPSAGERIAA